MSWRVLKFGGSSLGAPDGLSRALDRIAAEVRVGPVAVVVSAMGTTTDELHQAVRLAAAGDLDGAIALQDRIADRALGTSMAVLGSARLPEDRPPPAQRVRTILESLGHLLRGVSLVRERTPQTVDHVLAYGERLSAALVADLLVARGLPGLAVDARTWLRTDDAFGRAHVDREATRAAVERLAPDWEGHIPVHTGFTGQTADGRTTTLGRNGSDYTASLLAAGLGAAELIGWTDVPGVMSADPSIVREARPLPRMSYMEALELANFGASLFHPRTMVPLIESGIPLRIRRTLDPDAPGTLVDATGDPDVGRATSVTSLDDLALVDLQLRHLGPRTRVVERTHEALADAGVTVWMSNTAGHGQGVAMVVPQDELDRTRGALERAFALELSRDEVTLGHRAPITLLTLVAEAMGTRSNVAGRLFAALGAVGVNVRAIAQGGSNRSISCVVDASETATAVRAVHDAFHLAHQEVNLLVLGKGVVGSQLLRQITEQAATLEARHDVRLRLVGLADSQGFVFDEAGLDPSDVDGLVARRTPWEDGADPAGLLPRLRRLAVPILVDVTAAGGLEDLYEAAFQAGIHVVAANKKPLTGSLADHRRLAGAARRASRAFHYETTVGASLPVIQTLKDLVRTGDRVGLIEGALSGTLGFLTTEVMAGVPLSAAVRDARERGYTEPHPRDDLSGTDAARKALILARELGLELEMADVAVEPLVPRELLAHDDLDAFFAALEEHDPVVADEVARLEAEGQVLRYLARIEAPAEGPARLVVGPTAVPRAHPAASLRGAEAFVGFTTARYTDYPLIVRGAGAGGAVTAAGVLADVLKIAQTLRGR